jgi:hypothetical protein
MFVQHFTFGAYTPDLKGRQKAFRPGTVVIDTPLATSGATNEIEHFMMVAQAFLAGRLEALTLNVGRSRVHPTKETGFSRKEGLVAALKLQAPMSFQIETVVRGPQGIVAIGSKAKGFGTLTVTIDQKNGRVRFNIRLDKDTPSCDYSPCEREVI